MRFMYWFRQGCSLIAISLWWNKIILRLRESGVGSLSSAFILMVMCVLQGVISEDANAFDPGIGANDRVDALAVQADGKVILVGPFTSINGIPRVRIARLNADGSVDGVSIPRDEEGNDFLFMVLPAIIAANKAITGTYYGTMRFTIITSPGSSVSGSDRIVIRVNEDRTIVVNPGTTYPGSGTLSGNSANFFYPAQNFNLPP